MSNVFVTFQVNGNNERLHSSSLKAGGFLRHTD